MWYLIEDEDSLITIIKHVPYMEVVITSRQEIKSKNGAQYFLYKGISKSGDTVEAFLNDTQEIEIGIPQSARASKEQVEELFKTLPVVDIQFNQRGRLDTIQF